jgi:hypothetical protein
MLGFSDREVIREPDTKSEGTGVIRLQVNVLDCIHRRKGMFEMPWSRYCIWDGASGGGNSRCMMKIRCFLIVAE